MKQIFSAVNSSQKNWGLRAGRSTIIRGKTSRHKVVRIEGVVEQEVQEKLLRKDRCYAFGTMIIGQEEIDPKAKCFDSQIRLHIS